jgi:hypothetical protein
MGFYFRKSLSFGGLRIHFSQSGVGVSAGVRGFRIGAGPRGLYVHMGTNGLYYKKMIGSKKSASRSTRPEPPRVVETTINDVQMQDIESDDVLNISDADSQDIVNEINRNYGKITLWPIGVVAGILSTAMISSSFLMAGIPLIILLYLLDRKRKTTLMIYDIDSITESKIQSFYDTFDELIKAKKKWHISAMGHVSENQRKYHAGAGNLVRRSAIQIHYAVPKYIKTNVKVPCIPVGKQKLYFFPDRVFLIEKNKAGAVSYRNLVLECTNSRFIEEGPVPRDTQIVGQTWRYVNKKGGPDRRFKNNRQLPICLYSELWFRSNTGLNEKIQISKPDAGIGLMNGLSNYDFLLWGNAIQGWK